MATPFDPIGTLASGCLGCTQVHETYDYNSRVQPAMIQMRTSANPSNPVTPVLTPVPSPEFEYEFRGFQFRSSMAQ